MAAAIPGVHVDSDSDVGGLVGVQVESDSDAAGPIGCAIDVGGVHIDSESDHISRLPRGEPAPQRVERRKRGVRQQKSASQLLSEVRLLGSEAPPTRAWAPRPPAGSPRVLLGNHFFCCCWDWWVYPQGGRFSLIQVLSWNPFNVF